MKQNGQNWTKQTKKLQMDIIGHNGQYWTMDIMDKIGQNQQKKVDKIEKFDKWT